MCSIHSILNSFINIKEKYKMNAPKRRYRKRTTKTTKKSSRRPATRVTTAVKSYVKKTIHKMAENKTIGSSLNLAGNPTNAATSGWVTNNVYPLAFNDTTLICSQSVSQQGRIGNKVRIMKARVQYILTPTPYNAATNSFPAPIEVRVFIFSFKNQPVEGVNGSINQFNGIFQNGSGSFSFSNTLADQLANFNSDYLNVYYDKKHKLGYAAYEGSGSSVASQYYQNNDHKLNVKNTINCTKYLSKQYIWNDTALKPTSGKQVYIAFIPSLAQGNSLGATQQLFNIWYDMKIDFEDM